MQSKLITRLTLGLSHLREHKFKHSFQDTLNPLCNCGQDIESTTHFFLHCHFFVNERRTLLSTIRSLNSKLLDFTNYDLTQTLLFGNSSQTSRINFKIIKAPIDYILSSKRFDEPLFLNKFFHQLISKSEFNQQFSFLQSSVFCFTYMFIIVISYFILPGSFRYIDIWRSCNFVCLCFFVYLLGEVKCKFIIIYIYKKEQLQEYHYTGAA